MSRKITREAVRAFYLGRPFSSANTRVYIEDNEVKMMLHSTVIASRVFNPVHGPQMFYNVRTGDYGNHKLTLNTGGWTSNTTKERLNGLVGVSVYQKNFQWFLNGKEWDGNKIEVII
jgi:hypothetical protein